MKQLKNHFFSKILLALTVIFCAQPMFADTIAPAKTKEIHLIIQSFYNFNMGVMFKRQMGKKSFFRIGLVEINGMVNRVSPSISANFPQEFVVVNLGMESGIEFRKKISEGFSFFHGPGLSVSSSLQQITNMNPSMTILEQQRINSGVTFKPHYSLGIIGNIKNNWYASFFTNPGFHFFYEERLGGFISDRVIIRGAGFGFSENPVNFALAMRF